MLLSTLLSLLLLLPFVKRRYTRQPSRIFSRATLNTRATVSSALGYAAAGRIILKPTSKKLDVWCGL